eukprot:480164_1
MDPIGWKCVSHNVLNNQKKWHLSLSHFNLENKELLIVPKDARLKGGMPDKFRKKKRGRKRKLSDSERQINKNAYHARHNKKRRVGKRTLSTKEKRQNELDKYKKYNKKRKK